MLGKLGQTFIWLFSSLILIKLQQSNLIDHIWIVAWASRLYFFFSHNFSSKHCVFYEQMYMTFELPLEMM